MTRAKQRSGTNALQTHRALMANVCPPCPPEVAAIPGGEKHWSAAVAVRMTADWDEHGLLQVGQMCRLLAMADEHINLLAAEGVTTTSAKGLPMPNPRLGGIQQLLSSAATIRRGLGLNQGPDPRTINAPAARRSLAKSSKGAKSATGDTMTVDDLYY